MLIWSKFHTRLLRIYGTVHSKKIFTSNTHGKAHDDKFLFGNIVKPCIWLSVKTEEAICISSKKSRKTLLEAQGKSRLSPTHFCQQYRYWQNTVRMSGQTRILISKNKEAWTTKIWWPPTLSPTSLPVLIMRVGKLLLAARENISGEVAGNRRNSQQASLLRLILITGTWVRPLSKSDEKVTMRW